MSTSTVASASCSPCSPPMGTFGLGTLHTFENDTGPDDANHAQDGLLIVSGPGIAPRGPISGMQLMDVTPTILRLFGIEVPADMQGRVVEEVFDPESALS